MPEKKRWDRIVLHEGSSTKKWLGILACLNMDCTVQFLCGIRILLKLMTKSRGQTFPYHFFGWQIKMLQPPNIESHRKASEQNLSFSLFSLKYGVLAQKSFNGKLSFRGRLCTLSVLEQKFVVCRKDANSKSNGRGNEIAVICLMRKYGWHCHFFPGLIVLK